MQKLSDKNFDVPDNVSIAQALEIFKKTFGMGDFLDQSQVSLAVKILENPDYPIKLFGHELFPGRTTLKRHDYLQAICNAAGDNDGEAFVIGITMASTGTMNGLKSFLFLWLTNLFAPKAFHFNARARGIFYRTVKECTELVRGGILKDISVFPIENRLSDSVGSIRKLLGLDAVISKRDYLYGQS